MKKFKLHAVALLVVVSSAFTSCSNDDGGSVDLVLKKSFVTAVAGPETGDLNQELSLNVTFTVDNSCGVFHSFVETTQANTKTVDVQAAYAGKDCGTTPVTKSTVYKFKTATAGTYALKFKKTATEFITHTIVIE